MRMEVPSGTLPPSVEAVRAAVKNLIPEAAYCGDLEEPVAAAATMPPPMGAAQAQRKKGEERQSARTLD